MGLEYINRLGWIVIGTIFGLVLGVLWAQTQLNPPVQTVGHDEFENAVFQHDPTTKQPLVRHVVVQPPVLSEATGSKIRIVTFERLYRHKVNRSIWWIPQKLIAETPYVPRYGNGAAGPDLTIEKYLDSVIERYPEVSYRRAWWLVPGNAALCGAGLGFVLIGGIWPTLLGLMSGTGLGRKNNPKYKDYQPLWKMKNRTAPSAHRPQVTQAQMARVEAVADAYEQNLAQYATSSSSGGGAATGSRQEVRSLDARPLEEAKPLPNPDADDDIEVKGEYYPVMIHHKKAHEGPPDEPHPPAKHP